MIKVGPIFGCKIVRLPVRSPVEESWTANCSHTENESINDDRSHTLALYHHLRRRTDIFVRRACCRQEHILEASPEPWRMQPVWNPLEPCGGRPAAWTPDTSNTFNSISSINYSNDLLHFFYISANLSQHFTTSVSKAVCRWSIAKNSFQMPTGTKTATAKQENNLSINDV